MSELPSAITGIKAVSLMGVTRRHTTRPSGAGTRKLCAPQEVDQAKSANAARKQRLVTLAPYARCAGLVNSERQYQGRDRCGGKRVLWGAKKSKTVAQCAKLQGPRKGCQWLSSG